jgi:hypothetical protein
MQAVAQDL